MSFHTSSEEHIRHCESCQRRLTFMDRLGFEAVEVARDLDMDSEEAVITLVDLAFNVALQNDMMNVLIGHMGGVLHAIADERKNGPGRKRPGPRKSDE